MNGGRFFLGLYATFAIASPPLASEPRTVAVHGDFAAPRPDSVKIVLHFAETTAECRHRLQAGGSTRLCSVQIPPGTRYVRAEVVAAGFEPWTRNVLVDGNVVKLGTIALREASPHGVVMRSARILELRNSEDFLLEAVIENVTDSRIPLNSLVLEASQNWGVQCGEPAPPNPWQQSTQQVRIDWALLGSSDPDDRARAAWTRLHGEEILAEVRFRAANCGDYDNRLTVAIPLGSDLQARDTERIRFRVGELHRPELEAGGLGSLGSWEVIRVTVETTVEGAPVSASKEVRRP